MRTFFAYLKITKTAQSLKPVENVQTSQSVFSGWSYQHGDLMKNKLLVKSKINSKWQTIINECYQMSFYFNRAVHVGVVSFKMAIIKKQIYILLLKNLTLLQSNIFSLKLKAV